ncbi:MAG: hypothetical protein K0S71_571 [Clostridia bacterium]|jgi:hypothetical protein|nr:hypothetical protein [Clostridia bacterium]
MTPLFLKLEDVKSWLRLESDYTDEDTVLNMLILSAEMRVKGAIDNFEQHITDEHFKAAASVICFMLITDWYERRDFSGGISEKMRYTIQSLMLQLQTLPIPTL